jgi:hypothetical protein
VGATVNGEPDSWLIEQAVQEYEAYCAGRLDMSVDAIEAVGGQIQRCGSLEDEAHWTIAYVRDEDEAVLPLAVGERAQSLEQFSRLDRADVPIWDRRYFPPPVAVVDGAPRHFRPARGRFLVGVAQLSRRAVLLVATGESLAVVHLAGQARVVLFRGRPLSFREIDVDAMLRSQPSRGARRPEAPLTVRPPAAVRAQHLRIVGAVPVDVGQGPSIASVLEYGFSALARRAEAVKLASKRKGKTRVREVLDALYQALLAGCDDFEGMAGEVLSQFRALGPELDLTSAVFADVLRLLHATGTCLVERPTPRRWRINLVGLTDPRSPLHRRFCAETQGRPRRRDQWGASTGERLADGLPVFDKDKAHRRHGPVDLAGLRARGRDADERRTTGDFGERDVLLDGGRAHRVRDLGRAQDEGGRTCAGRGDGRAAPGSRHPGAGCRARHPLPRGEGGAPARGPGPRARAGRLAGRAPGADDQAGDRRRGASEAAGVHADRAALHRPRRAGGSERGSEGR